MRSCLFFVAGAILSIPAGAQQTMESCKSIATAAEFAMEYRQSGVDIIEAYDVFEGLEGAEAAMARAIVTAAYGMPVYPEGKREWATREFKTHVMLVCMEKVDD